MHVYQWKVPTNVMQQYVIWIVNSDHSFKTKAFIVRTAYPTCSISSCCITDPLLSSSESLWKFQIAISDACASSWVTRDETDPSFDWPQKRYVDIEQQQVERVTVIISFCLRLSGRLQRFASLLSRSHHHEFGGHLFRGKQNFVSDSRDDWQLIKQKRQRVETMRIFVVHLIVSASDSLSTVYFIINSGFFQYFLTKSKFYNFE